MVRSMGPPYVRNSYAKRVYECKTKKEGKCQCRCQPVERGPNSVLNPQRQFEGIKIIQKNILTIPLTLTQTHFLLFQNLRILLHRFDDHLQ